MIIDPLMKWPFIWAVHSDALHLTLIGWKFSKVTMNLLHGGNFTLNKGKEGWNLNICQFLSRALISFVPFPP